MASTDLKGLDWNKQVNYVSIYAKSRNARWRGRAYKPPIIAKTKSMGKKRTRGNKRP